MADKLATLMLVVLIGLAIVACGSDSDDVPSLDSGDTKEAEPTAEVGDPVRDSEAAMMALTQCLRDQGIEVYDPVVDADGNVQKPELVEGVDPKGMDLAAAWEACAEHLEGITFGKERVDETEMIDQLLALTTCLRDKGYSVDDPTAGMLDQWKGNLIDAVDFKDPEASADYEECSSTAGMGKGGK